MGSLSYKSMEFRKYKALLYKDLLQLKRSFIGSFCEIFFPVAIMATLYSIRVENYRSYYSAETFSDESDKSLYLSPHYNKSQTANNAAFDSCFYLNEVDGSAVLSYAIISNDTTFNYYMASKINELYPFHRVDPYFISSERDLEDYIKSPEYENNQKICFAVVFNDLGDFQYELDLRFNVTQPLSLDNSGEFLDIFNIDFHSATDPMVSSPTTFAKDFYRYGFLSLINIVDNYILGYSFNKYLGSISATIRPMRFHNYYSDNFFIYVHVLLSFLVAVGFLVPVCRLVSRIVKEKELKDMMIVMGLSRFEYWAALISYYIAVYSIIAGLLTVMIVYGNILSFSSSFWIFVMFWLFGMSCIAFSVLVSTLFSRTFTGNFFAAFLFMSSFVIGLLVSVPFLPAYKKMMASLLPVTAFELGFVSISRLEIARRGIQDDNLNYQIQNYSFGMCLIFISLDIFYMSLFAAYFENLWPTTWGVRRPWYFFVTKNFWCGNKNATQNNPQKYFPQALDDTKLNINENEVFAFLGPIDSKNNNILSIVTESQPEVIIKGKKLSADLNNIRLESSLGFCAQKIVLFQNLTPAEHLYLYSRLGNLNDEAIIKNMIDEILEDLKLEDVRNIICKKLQDLDAKKKLCVGIALIGDPDVVFLDHPTFEMDQINKIDVWNTIKRKKNRKSILLATNCVEEADFLADRVAIMSSGKIKRYGTLNSLKSPCLNLMKENSTKSKKIIRFIKRYTNKDVDITENSTEISFQLSQLITPNLSDLLRDLDENMKKLKILSYSISGTTLKELFLKETENISMYSARLDNYNQKQEFLDIETFNSSKILLKAIQKFKITVHFGVIWYKRYKEAISDYKLLIFDTCMPIFIIMIGLGFMSIPIIFKDYDRYELTISNYESTQTLLYGGTANGTNLMSQISNVYIENTNITSLETFSDYLTVSTDKTPSHMGAYYFDTIDETNKIYSYEAYINQTAFQAAPTFYHAMSSSILTSINPIFSMKVYNYPLPYTKKMGRIENWNGSIASLVFCLGLSFIPVSIINYIAQEKQSKVKKQLIVSGISLKTYWIANLIWDIVKNIYLFLIFWLMLSIFRVNESDVSASDNNTCMAMLILVYGVTIVPFAYVCSFLSKSHTNHFAFSFITGSLFPTFIYIMYFFSNTRTAAKVLIWIFSVLSPCFAFGWGVFAIENQANLNNINQEGEHSAFDINIGGRSLIVLGSMFIVYLIILIIIEKYPKQILKIKKNLLANINQIHSITIENNDSNLNEPCKIVFNENEGKFFVILETNENRQENILEIIAEELIKGSESVFIDNPDSNITNYSIGCCFRYNGLIESLTVTDHLRIYAGIKGVSMSVLESQFRSILNEVNKNIPIILMGNNDKKKLSTAISLIGSPDIILLDHRSHNMDTDYHKALWDHLNQLKLNKSSIILVTDSIVDEDLCDEIFTVNKNTLRSIGTPNIIKTKFKSQEYELQIRFNDPNPNFIEECVEKFNQILGEDEIGPENVYKLIEAAGFEDLVKEKLFRKFKEIIFETFLRYESIEREKFAIWCAIENQKLNFTKLLSKCFEECTLIDDYHSICNYLIIDPSKESPGDVYLTVQNQKNNNPPLVDYNYSIALATFEKKFNRYIRKSIAK
jgi:ATP-binding cassette, subfamily A (ABC1), member 3